METAATNAVETGAAAPEPTQETESAPVTTEAQAEQAVPEAKKPESEPEWFQKRMNELTARFHQRDRRAQELEQELRSYREREQTRPVEAEKPKTLADFEYNEVEYQSYLFTQAEKRAVEAAKRARVEEASARDRESRARKFQEREIAFQKETADYKDVAYYAPVSDDVAELIRAMENGPAVAYYLGKHRDIALTLNDYPPQLAAMELGRIDAKLSAEKSAKAAALEAAKAAKAVSQAPAPTPRIEGSGDAQSIKVDQAESDALSDAEWTRRRNQQEARRRANRS